MLYLLMSRHSTSYRNSPKAYSPVNTLSSMGSPRQTSTQVHNTDRTKKKPATSVVRKDMPLNVAIMNCQSTVKKSIEAPTQAYAGHKRSAIIFDHPLQITCIHFAFISPERYYLRSVLHYWFPSW